MNERNLARGGALAFAIAIAAAVALRAGMPVRAQQTGGDGYVGTGTLVARVNLGGSGQTLTIGGNLNVEQTGSLYRLEVTSLSIPGTDATLGSIAAMQLFPAGGVSAVFDRSTLTYTVWSPARRAYYSGRFGSGSAGAQPRATTSAQAANGSTDAVAAVLGVLREIKAYKQFRISLALGPKETVNAHPSTPLDYQFLRDDADGISDFHGRLDVADDLDGLPSRLTLDAKAKGLPDTAARLDFLTFAKRRPADGDFIVPNGYTRVDTIGDVLKPQGL